MSSPFRSSDRSTSSRRSTTSRNLQNGHRPINGIYTEGASSQLLGEYGRMSINGDRNFTQALDEQGTAQKDLHIEALNRALAKHQEVRESAERTRERVELEIQHEERRRLAEQHEAVERARRQLEEQKLAEKKRLLDEERAREDVRRRDEALQREQEEQARQVQLRREHDVRVRRESEEKSKQDAERRAKEAEEAREREHKAAQQAAKPTPSPILQNGNLQAAPQPAAPAHSDQPPGGLPAGIIATQSERAAIHKRYLDLHQRLKAMREEVPEMLQKHNPSLKTKVSDWRRDIKKFCGQLNRATFEERVREVNKTAKQQVVRTLDQAAQAGGPMIDFSPYLVENHQPPNANTQGPAIMIFLLSHFSKNVLRQQVAEGVVDEYSAAPLADLAATIFARPQYHFNGQTLMDVYWAKHHFLCPALYGATGDEKTRGGRLKVGWTMSGSEGDQFITENEHHSRQAGLAAGFAAITLRDYSKSAFDSPAPPRMYWEILARFLNTPARDLQPTHFVILKAMIENYAPRIMNQFGGAGLALLRQALIVFPRDKGIKDKNGEPISFVRAVSALPDILQQSLHLKL